MDKSKNLEDLKGKKINLINTDNELQVKSQYKVN